MRESTTRFTLDLELLFQRRLKVMAALKGVTMREYCVTAIEKELAKDEVEGAGSLAFGTQALERLKALQTEVFKGRRVQGDSAEIIRKSRQARARAL